METTIELTGMKFFAYHGVGKQELLVGNYYLVDVRYTFWAEAACTSDTIEDTINYADVFELIKNEMSHPSKLLEHVAARLLQALKLRFDSILGIRLKVSKLNPPLMGEVQSASVVLEKHYR